MGDCKNVILILIFFFCIDFRAACHSSLFQAWETFLQEIEADSQSTSDVASALSRQVNIFIFFFLLIIGAIIL